MKTILKIVPRTVLTAVALLAVELNLGHAQPYSFYSDDRLQMESVFLKESISLNLHLPETHPMAAEGVTYPVLIVFDSQHERTYPQIIRSIDMLSGETQMPEMVVVGVPFNMENRLYRTSDQKRQGDTLTGIERMERFLFEEVIPLLRSDYKVNEFVGLIGHSRTAFLVNYLSMTRIEDVNLAIALSGFYEEDPLSLQAFSAFLTDQNRFDAPFSYYATAGTTREEETYLVQSNKLKEALGANNRSGKVNIEITETPSANHITNFWMAAPGILANAFAPYNDILDRWLHQYMQHDTLSQPLSVFENDLIQTGNTLGCELLPSLTHIYSITSYYGNQKNDHDTALEFLDFGIRYYPDCLDLYVDAIATCRTLADSTKTEHYKDRLREKVLKNETLTSEERDEFIRFLNEP